MSIDKLSWLIAITIVLLMITRVVADSSKKLDRRNNVPQSLIWAFDCLSFNTSIKPIDSMAGLICSLWFYSIVLKRNVYNCSYKQYVSKIDATKFYSVIKVDLSLLIDCTGFSYIKFILKSSLLICYIRLPEIDADRKLITSPRNYYGQPKATAANFFFKFAQVATL